MRACLYCMHACSWKDGSACEVTVQVTRAVAEDGSNNITVSQQAVELECGIVYVSDAHACMCSRDLVPAHPCCMLHGC